MPALVEQGRRLFGTRRPARPITGTTYGKPEGTGSPGAIYGFRSEGAEEPL